MLGAFSLLKLMFLGIPKLIDSWPLLIGRVMSVPDDLLGVLVLPKVSLLSSGLFDNGYGTIVVTLQKTDGI